LADDSLPFGHTTGQLKNDLRFIFPLSPISH
jgi:hypothetical protein